MDSTQANEMSDLQLQALAGQAAEEVRSLEGEERQAARVKLNGLQKELRRRGLL